MKYMAHGTVVLAILFLMFSGVASAHHALQAEFDPARLLKLEGTLARIEWVNPHAYFWFDVKNDKGEVKLWGAEFPSAGVLRSAGFLRGPASFKIGDPYTIEGFASKDGGDRIYATAINLPDGRRVRVWFGDQQSPPAR